MYAWLASPYSNVNYNNANFGMRAVNDGNMSGWNFVNSNDNYNGEAIGVRAVDSKNCGHYDQGIV